MKGMNRWTFACILAVQPWLPLAAGTPSQNPRVLGEVVLHELSIQDGKVAIRVDSGGCTDKAAIRANLRKQKGPADLVPQVVVTFERVRADDCKALLLDGVRLEYDLVRDLGLSGRYTLVVANPVLRHDAVRETEGLALKRALLAATQRAIDLELRGYEARLKTAEAGTGPAGNVALFQNRVAEAKARLAQFQNMPPADYPMPTEEAPRPFDGEGQYGPVVPAQRQTIRVTPEAPCREGSLLGAEGATRSGPFYHVAGGAYERMEPGRTYNVTVYLVYKRDYFGHIPDNYVYIAEVK